MGKILFIGGSSITRYGHGGETLKNSYFISYLRSKGYQVNVADTVKLKRNPLLFLEFLFHLLFGKSQIVVSVATHTAFNLFKMLHLLGWTKRRINYFVIGGTIGERIKTGQISIDILKKIHKIYVETFQLEKSLKESGLENVERLPNFKPIVGKKPQLKILPDQPLRIVYISRVIASKGIFVLIEAVNKLYTNQNVLLDIYGPIGKEEELQLKVAIENKNYISYKGVVDFNHDPKAYEKLSSYHLMVLPTSHYGEGFPGIFIDCFISGVPVLTTDWNSNSDIIKHGFNGILIPNSSIETLYQKLKQLIDNPTELEGLRMNCQASADQYDIDTVLNPIFLA